MIVSKLAIYSAVISLVLVTGCATHDYRDRPWDPPNGRALFEQIPAWDRAAQQQCCGHLKSCAKYQTNRC
jgi:hypothetical protein